jgi:hypothetical protein
LEVDFVALEEEAVAFDFGALAKAPGFGVAVCEGEAREETAAKAVEGFVVMVGGGCRVGRVGRRWAGAGEPKAEGGDGSEEAIGSEPGNGLVEGVGGGVGLEAEGELG